MADLFEPPEPIKAVSLWQPWASLLAAGAKVDETRHWWTPYRGPIAIHAAKTLDRAGAPDELCQSVFGISWRDRLPAGAIVAVGRLVNVQPAAYAAQVSTRANRTAGNFAPGRFAWRLDRIRALREPIACVGRQGLFNWVPPDDLEARLGPAVDHQALCHAIGWLKP